MNKKNWFFNYKKKKVDLVRSSIQLEDKVRIKKSSEKVMKLTRKSEIMDSPSGKHFYVH
jgi:hypothetical protein